RLSVRLTMCARRVIVFFFFQAEDGIRDLTVTGVQTCALPISLRPHGRRLRRRALSPGTRRRRRTRSRKSSSRRSRRARTRRRSEIGRASCRERGEKLGGGGSLKKKNGRDER